MIAHLLAAMPRIGTGAPRLSGAIVQSGAAAGTLDAPTIEWVGEQLLDAAGVRDAAALRDLPLAAILDAQERTVDAALGKVGMMPFHPWIDGDLLDAPPFRAALADVPLVVGTNANEMELFRDQVPALPEAVAVSFLARKASSLGIADEGTRPRRACARVTAIWSKRWPTSISTCRTSSWRAAPATRQPGLALPVQLAGTGPRRVSRARSAVHLRHPRRRRLARLRRRAHEPRADALSQRMRTAWTSFARSGRPADGIAGSWPEHELVHLGRRLERRDDAVARRVGIWLGEAHRHERAGRSSGDRHRSQPRHRQGVCARAGAAGATVYVTGRSVSESDHPLPGTVGATAQRSTRSAEPGSRSRATIATMPRSPRSSTVSTTSTDGSTSS